jgi:flavin-dependent thymidylate synthase
VNVELLTYTDDALTLLVFTKQTRLKQDSEGYAEVHNWSLERKLEELKYMRGTIQSSWEFVDYTFAISGVSRAFTHQLVRTRAGSYAQQSQRTVDMTGFDFIWPESLAEPSSASGVMDYTLDKIQGGYEQLLKEGVKPEDARAILPTNVATNIIAKFSLRTLSDMAKVRLCFRTQGEYQDVFAEMRERVIEVHPWATDFIQVHCAATGVCCFPNWNGCPIKGPVYNADTGLRWDQQNEGYVPELDEWIKSRPATRAQIQAAWERARSKVPQE